MFQPLRKFNIHLFIGGLLAVVNGRATFKAMQRCRIVNTEFSLGIAPTGAGNTAVTVKKNGNAIGAATDLQLAAAATSVRSVPTVTAQLTQGEPTGVQLEPGDTVTVDVTAICATTAGTDGTITLECAMVDA
jgi:hypothetical protein